MQKSIRKTWNDVKLKDANLYIVIYALKDVSAH